MYIGFDKSHPYQRKEEKLPNRNNHFQYTSVRKKFLSAQDLVLALCMQTGYGSWVPS